MENRELILNLPALPGAMHDGGIVILGPTPTPGPGQVGDGSFLYVVVGDLARRGQLQNHPEGAAPDDSSVILRLRQDGSPAPGNPFVPYCSLTTSKTCPNGTGCSGGETCITAVSRYLGYGIRNSFGLAVDPVTGSLWDTENGPTSYDEINLVLPGFNSGWNQIMGPLSRAAQGVDALFNLPGGVASYHDPEFSWVATVAPTAILFPVGSALGPAYDNVALVGDNNFGNLFAIPLNTPRDAFDFGAFPSLQDLVADNATERELVRLGTGFGSITDLKVGPDGAVYAVDILAPGRILKISGPSPTATATPSATPSRTSSPTATPSLAPTCPASPLVCRTSSFRGKTRIRLRDDPDDTKDLLVWKWIRGAATTAAELGSPATSDTYQLCVYDGSGLVMRLAAPAGGTCGGVPCWTQDPTGFRYDDPEGSRDGLRRIILQEGVDGRAQIIVRARGVHLTLPDPAGLRSPVTVQLTRTGGSACWGARYSFPPALRKDARAFNDSAD